MLHGDVLGERARLNPDRTALVFVPTGARFTYAELDARALRTARALRGLGLSPGDRVAILAHNRPEFLDVFFASGKSGHVCLPLGTRLTPVELAAVLRDAGARVLVHDGALADTVAGLRALGDLPVEHVVALDGDGPSTLSKRVATHAEDDRPFARPRPEDLYALLYTSGTTGRPKGVMLPHRMIAFNAFTTAIGWGLREDDVSPVFTPLYHAGGLGAFLMPILAVGGTVVLHTGFDAAEVFRTLAAEGCTVALGVPTIFKLMLEHPGFATADFSRIRWFISGGAPLPAFVIEAFQRRGVGFKQGFGMTEVGVNCFAMTLEDSVRQAGSIGRPLPFTEARLVDATGAEVPVGEVGELWLRGPHVCLGYWNDRSATAAALDADGFFHTGDLARRNAEGFYTIAGRRKDMFISGGVNVYPAEIEGALLLHPAVQDAAIAGVPHPTWGEVGVAFVVLRPGLTATPGELESFLAASLARFKLPRRYVFRDALPRTPYGKVVKAELVASLSGA
jgi:fatty-acyl-CoA synthase